MSLATQITGNGQLFSLVGEHLVPGKSPAFLHKELFGAPHKNLSLAMLPLAVRARFMRVTLQTPSISKIIHLSNVF